MATATITPAQNAVVAELFIAAPPARPNGIDLR